MLGGMSLFHWIIVLAVVLLLFGGRNKVSDLMGDVAKGIKSFKKGMNEDDVASAPPTAPQQPLTPVRTIDHQAETIDKPVEVRKVS